MPRRSIITELRHPFTNKQHFTRIPATKLQIRSTTIIMSSIVRFLTALLVLCSAASYYHINAERVCGRNLLETMKIVCKYQFETIGKRSGKLSCLFVDSTSGEIPKPPYICNFRGIRQFRCRQRWNGQLHLSAPFRSWSHARWRGTHESGVRSALAPLCCSRQGRTVAVLLSHRHCERVLQ